MKQTTFASAAYDHKKVTTKREKFLQSMDKLAPWQRLLALIEPHYPKKGNGRPPINMQTMLRVYCLQQWYNLSDPGVDVNLRLKCTNHFVQNVPIFFRYVTR